MVELNSEELKSLTELVEVAESGKSVDEFIKHRLYSELSHTTNPDSMGDFQLIKHPGFDKQYGVYESLVDKGLLSGRHYPRTSGTVFGNLTSDGRCYLSDKKTRDKAERDKIKSQRTHDFRVAAFGAVFGAISGAITGFFGGLLSAQAAELVSSLLGL